MIYYVCNIYDLIAVHVTTVYMTALYVAVVFAVYKEYLEQMRTFINSYIYILYDCGVFYYSVLD